MNSYYKPEHLANFGGIAEGNDELAKRFFSYYGEVFAEGALSVREKALIALAVAHAVQCPYCIESYSSERLTKGVRSRGDDRGGPRGDRDSRWGLARSWSPNARTRNQEVHVSQLRCMKRQI